MSAVCKVEKKDRHVILNPRGGWSVRQTGASKASRTFANERDAVKYGRDLARKEQGGLYIHRKDGTIKDRNSYGSDGQTKSKQ